jgi:hypothetical protein
VTLFSKRAILPTAMGWIVYVQRTCVLVQLQYQGHVIQGKQVQFNLGRLGPRAWASEHPSPLPRGTYLPTVGPSAQPSQAFLGRAFNGYSAAVGEQPRVTTVPSQELASSMGKSFCADADQRGLAHTLVL